MKKKTTFPLDAMLKHKGEDFSALFVKTMNLYLSTTPGQPLSDKDKLGRIRKMIEDYSRKA